MATAAELCDGALRLRDMQGTCDLCGDECHPSAEICTFTACNRCDGGVFHQHCIEKFLKKYGYDSTRKTGFPCPIGRGKKTKFAECKGLIGKSHPIIPKNEEKKKKALPPPIHEVMSRQPKGKDAVKGAAKQPLKPPAMPRKVAPPKAYQVAATVLRSGAVMIPDAPPTAVSVWHTAATNNAIRQAGDPAPAAAVLTEPHQPRSVHVPVGLVLEEALTKAQKKNLARRKKKVQVNGAGADAVSETGTAATDVSSLDDFAAFNEQHKGSMAGTSSAAHQLLNGTNFVTDIKRYQQLLGMYCGDSDDEEEGESDSALESESSQLSGEVEPELSLTMTSASSARPGSSASVTSTAAIYCEHALASAQEHDQDAVLRVALEQSAREYALQQELQHQREILAGCGNDAAQLLSNVAAVVANEAPALSFPDSPIIMSPAIAPLVTKTPVAPPIAVPVATPLVVTEAQPTTFSYSATNVGYQQPQALWPQQQAYAAPHIATAAAPATYGAGHGAAPYAPMAAGHDLLGASSADDDDLGSLLALCGVAG